MFITNYKLCINSNRTCKSDLKIKMSLIMTKPEELGESPNFVQEQRKENTSE